MSLAPGAGEAGVAASNTAVMVAEAQAEGDQVKPTEAAEAAARPEQVESQASQKATEAKATEAEEAGARAEQVVVQASQNMTQSKAAEAEAAAAAAAFEVKDGGSDMAEGKEENGTLPNGAEGADVGGVEAERHQDEHMEGGCAERHEQDIGNEQKKGENLQDKQHTHGDTHGDTHGNCAEEQGHEHGHEHEDVQEHGHEHGHEKEKEQREDGENQPANLGKRKIKDESQPLPGRSGSVDVPQPSSAKSSTKEPAKRPRKAPVTNKGGSAGGKKAAAPGKATPSIGDCPIGMQACPLTDCTIRPPSFGFLGGRKMKKMGPKKKRCSQPGCAVYLSSGAKGAGNKARFCPKHAKIGKAVSPKEPA